MHMALQHMATSAAVKRMALQRSSTAAVVLHMALGCCGVDAVKQQLLCSVTAQLLLQCT